jgi:signal transduction histidine kinase
MMGVDKSAYEKLEARLAQAERIIEALRSEQVDAIVGKKNIYLIRLKEVEEALERAKDELEARVRERTAELEMVNEELRREVEIRRKTEDDLRDVSRRLLEAQETERRNIAFDLHDSIGSSLAGIKMAMEIKLNGIEQGKAPSESITMEEILDQVKKCIQHNLRPSVLDILGLAASLRSLCGDFEHMCSIKTDCTLGIDGGDVPENLNIIIYRISQEALSNAAKHSGAEHVNVSLIHQGGRIQLMVRDDGCGFEAEKAMIREKNGNRMGLSSMKERCELSGGTFSIHSRKDEGTTVHAEWICD